VAKRVEPKSQDQAVMQRQYQAYRRLYPALRSVLRNENTAAVG
jgi:hypothetical protein